MSRDLTRKERYDNKKRTTETYPISLCCVNFQHDGNLGFLIRAAACFNARRLHVIGSIPNRKLLNALSGSLYDYIEIKQHSRPSEFVDFSQANDIELVAAEIHESAEPLTTHRFNFDHHMCLVVGNEEVGVPQQILNHSTIVQIPMPGVGYCLNTSQAANILLYEAAKQYEAHCKAKARFINKWDDWECYHLP